MKVDERYKMAMQSQEPGIMNVWLFDELMHLPTQPNTIEDHIKKQLFRGRSGSVVLQTEPYTMITHWKEGNRTQNTV